MSRRSLLNPRITARTLSVVLSPTDSVTCGVELNEEYANISLRLEDDVAKLAGFPQEWGVFDTHVDQYDGSSPRYEDVIDEMDLPGDLSAYVSRDTEKEILKQIKGSIQKQFEDDMFKDQLDSKQKEQVLEKIEKALA